MMIRNLALVVVLAGVLGLAVGGIRHARCAEPAPIVRHDAAKPPVESRPSHAMVPASARQEFILLPADVAADRETPALAVDSEGRVLMAWASQTGELVRTLYLARSSDGGAHFEPPVAWRKVPIYRYTSKGRAGGSGMTYSTHVLPRLASAGAEINLGWVEAIDGGPKVLYYVARSSDGGRSFSSPMPVHGAGTVRPGFTTLAADADGTLLAGWLESQKPFVAVRPRGSSSFEPEQLVYDGPEDRDGGVCPCCDVGVLPIANGSPIVAFRNTDGGHRDIWLTRARRDGKAGFEPAVPVTSDPWSFDGCPHDGPALGTDRRDTPCPLDGRPHRQEPGLCGQLADLILELHAAPGESQGDRDARGIRSWPSPDAGCSPSGTRLSMAPSRSRHHRPQPRPRATAITTARTCPAAAGRSCWRCPPRTARASRLLVRSRLGPERFSSTRRSSSRRMGRC